MADDFYYGDASLNKRVFFATAIVTAPVIFSTAAGTGGPLLWNGGATKIGRLLRMGFAITTASAVSGSLGLTGGTGQAAAPSSTTAIDSTFNGYLGAPVSSITPYRIGTVSAAGTWFLPLAQVHTGAVTVDTTGMTWIDMERMITIPSGGGWVSVAASATLTSAVLQIVLAWEEIPVS